ncbi:RNA 2'-phosphotransferase [Palleronia salina]|uniref:RNA 2'-phosphotransferase n=1 Tax=Palleronia salina TaxID=313368 RepID=UPI000933A4A0|nr:RNA 2'-phosphotransferase [Palleronia salina]
MSRKSKFLSLILRHKPEEVGLTLDPAGWVPIDRLLRAMKAHGRPMSREELIDLIEGSEKKRFSISADGKLIRAAQGHSIDIDLGLTPREPPINLYHGTARHNLDGIFAAGLQPMRRRQVHLSVAPADAEAVGRRHGKPVVLRLAALSMHEEGHVFSRADNGVWLVDAVPPQFIGFWTEGT